MVPHRAFIASGRIHDLPVKPDQQALVLEADMTNRTAESSKDYFRLFQLATPLGGEVDRPFIVLARDSKLSPELQPGMTERMAYVWMLPKAAKLPADISLRRQHADLQAARQSLRDAWLVQRARARPRQRAGRKRHGGSEAIMRRIANIAALCVTALACYGMQISKPHYADLTGPIPAYGSMDDTVETRLFDVHVDRVVFAQSAQGQRVRQGEAADHRRPVGGRGDRACRAGPVDHDRLGDMARADRAALPADANGSRSRRACRRTCVDPGLPKKGRFIFEIPPGEANGATLLVSNTLYFALNSQARIALDALKLAPDGSPHGVVPVYDLDQPI